MQQYQKPVMMIVALFGIVASQIGIEISCLLATSTPESLEFAKGWIGINWLCVAALVVIMYSYHFDLEPTRSYVDAVTVAIAAASVLTGLGYICLTGQYAVLAIIAWIVMDGAAVSFIYFTWPAPDSVSLEDVKRDAATAAKRPD